MYIKWELHPSSYLRQKIKETQSRQSSKGGNDVIMGKDDPPLQGKASNMVYYILVRDAYVLMKARQYDLALYKLQSARVSSPEKSEEIDLRIQQMFTMINNDRKEAIYIANEAKKQKKDSLNLNQ